MSTPGDPLNIPVFSTPSQICPAIPNSTVLIQNTATIGNLYLGRNSGITPSNSLLLAPGASSIWDSTRATWAFTDADPGPIIALISPGTEQYNLGPQQIVDVLDITTLAISIATAIAQTGVSFLAAPTPLYGGAITPGGSTGPTVIVGATVGLNPFPAGTTVQQAADQFDAAVGRRAANAMEKVYLSEGVFPATITANAPISHIHDQGGSVFISVKPNYVQSAAQQTAFVAFLNMLAANGFNSSNCWITFWQEPNGGMAPFTSGADYLNYVNFYWTAAAKAVGFKSFFDPTIGGQDNATILSYYSAASFDGIAIDFYGSGYDRGLRADFLVAQANSDGKPFAIGEFGAVGQPSNVPPTAAQWTAYLGYLTTLLNDATHGTPFALYFNGTSANPNNIVPSSGTTYSKVPDFDTFYDTFSSGGGGQSGGVNVNSGATVVVPPLNPSPGAGYAVANGISYDIQVNAIAGVGSTEPFMNVRLIWYNQDSSVANIVAQQNWSVPMGSNGTTGTIITGAGPQHAQYLKITLRNLDSVAATASIQLNSTGRSEARHNWQWNVQASVAIPTPSEAGANPFSLAGGAQFANVVGNVNGVSIPAGGSKCFMFGLFAGQVQFKISAAAANMLTFALFPLPSSSYGSDAIFNETTNSDTQTILLPRGPCMLTVSNGGGAAVNGFAEMIALD